MGFWSDDRGTNLLDGGAHFYGAYETSDGHVPSRSRATSRSSTPSSTRLLGPLGIELDPATQMDQSQWPALKIRMAELFRTRTRPEWVEFFAGHDVCFAPVLTMNEAASIRTTSPRGTFTEVDGAPQPTPAPRFSRTPGAVERAPVVPGADTATALTDWGFSEGEVTTFRANGAVA